MDYVLVSEIFPPAVGGSGVLLDNIYRRVGNGRVTALVGGRGAKVYRADRANMNVRYAPMDSRAWGLLDAQRWPGQLRLSRDIYRLGAGGRGIVHCGRAQPEGVSAYLASLVPGGPPYVVWAHGEDISVAQSSRHFAWTMRRVYSRASGAFANSRNTAALLRASQCFDGEVHVAYPGVDGSRFTPAAPGSVELSQRLAPQGELLLLSVGRLQWRKGHELVLRALPALLREYPRLRYVIAGEGNQREKLTRLIVDLALGEIVHLAGEVAESDLPAYFAACDVFVLPTRVEPSDFEGFGIVFLEAAASGKPTLGGRNGGVSEAVSDGETGVLVDPERPEEILSALRALCASAELRTRMGAAGRARALRDFTWEAAARVVSEAHQAVAERSRTRR